MADIVRPARGGGGSPVPLVAFIITTIAGMVGCWLLYDPMMVAREALNDIQDNIGTHIEKPLGDANFNTRRQPPEKHQGVIYGDAFFSVAGNVIKDGIKYPKLLEKVGCTQKDPMGEIDGELSRYPKKPTPASLIDLVQRQRRDIDTLSKQLQNEVEAHKKSERLRRDAERERDKSRKALRGEVTDLRKRLSGLEGMYKNQIKRLQAEMQKVEANRKKTRHELLSKEQKLKQAQAGLTPLNKEIQKLKAEIDKLSQPPPKKPKPPGPDGKVLEVALSAGLVYIDLGKDDDLKRGTKFEVYEFIQGEVPLKKAEIEVTKVDERISTARILKSDPLNPILKGDYIDQVGKKKRARKAAQKK